MEERKIKEENLKQIAKEVIDKISLIKKGKASLIVLSGELGAGKTALSKEIAKYLGVKEKIISPTFVIMKIYKTKNKNFKKLIHIDAYRLSKDSELAILGWEEIMKDKGNIVLVEWPENVPICTALPICSIEIIHINEDTRNLKICYN